MFNFSLINYMSCSFETFFFYFLRVLFFPSELQACMQKMYIFQTRNSIFNFTYYLLIEYDFN